jgi:hypothetical protein
LKKTKQMLDNTIPVPATGLSSCKCRDLTTPACDRTQDKLDTLLKEANFDKMSPAYHAYFKSLTCSTNGEVMDHCKKCAKTIDMHATGDRPTVSALASVAQSMPVSAPKVPPKVTRPTATSAKATPHVVTRPTTATSTKGNPKVPPKISTNPTTNEILDVIHREVVREVEQATRAATRPPSNTVSKTSNGGKPVWTKFSLTMSVPLEAVKQHPRNVIRERLKGSSVPRHNGQCFWKVIEGCIQLQVEATCDTEAKAMVLLHELSTAVLQNCPNVSIVRSTTESSVRGQPSRWNDGNRMYMDKKSGEILSALTGLPSSDISD